MVMARLVVESTVLHNVVQHRCNYTSINITYLAVKYARCV